MTKKRKHNRGRGAVDLVVVISDNHPNSTGGLRPPVFFDKERQENRHAPRRIVEDLWEPFLAHAEDVKKERKRLEREGYTVRVIVAHLGDGSDRNKHDMEGYELLTVNRTVITDLAEASLEPLLKPGLVDLWILERGTQAHEGGSGELCEMLAERISHRANVWRKNDRDTWSHFEGRFDFQGVDMIFSHHPQARGKLIHTRDNAAAKTAHHYWDAFNIPHVCKNKTVYEREPTPDLMFFGHVHYDAEGGGSSSIPLKAVYVPSWQLPTDYVYGLGVAIVPNPVGARWVRCHDGEYHLYKTWLHTPRAAGPVTV